MATPKVRNGKLSRAERRRGERRRPWYTHTAFILGLLGVLAVAGYLVQSRREARVTGSLQRPTRALGPGGSEAIGPPEAPVLVEEYGDFECERCAEFHKTAGSQIRKLAEEGKIRLAYYPMLTRPGSLVLANAAVCAGDHGAFWRYHDHLFASQQAGNVGSHTPQELIQFGRQLGIDSPSFADCVTNGTYNGWLTRISAAGAARRIRTMPTVFVNGKLIRDPLTAPAAIEAALKATAR